MNCLKLPLSIIAAGFFSLPALANSSAPTDLNNESAKTTQSVNEFTVNNPSADNLFRTYLEPHWVLLRELRGGMQIRIGNNFSVGPVVALMSASPGMHASGYVSDMEYFDDTTTRYTLGVKTIGYLNHVNTSTPYMALSGTYSHVKVRQVLDEDFSRDIDNDTYEGSFAETVVNLSAGYQWHWGFMTLNVGAGASHYSHPKSVTLKAADNSQVVRKIKANRTAFDVDMAVGMSF